MVGLQQKLELESRKGHACDVRAESCPILKSFVHVQLFLSQKYSLFLHLRNSLQRTTQTCDPGGLHADDTYANLCRLAGANEPSAETEPQRGSFLHNSARTNTCSCFRLILKSASDTVRVLAKRYSTMDKVNEIIANVDAAIAQYPTITQYGM